MPRGPEFTPAEQRWIQQTEAAQRLQRRSLGLPEEPLSRRPRPGDPRWVGRAPLTSDQRQASLQGRRVQLPAAQQAALEREARRLRFNEGVEQSMNNQRAGFKRADATDNKNKNKRRR